MLKKKTPLFGGRLQLVKFFLSSLPVYFLSLFKMPTGVVKAIEKLQRDFLWGDGDVRRKLHAVKWERITCSKLNGGLGIIPIKTMNSALLAKWWWRFGKEKEALWRRVLCAKYKLENSAWLPYHPPRRRLSVVWGDITSLGRTGESLGVDLSHCFMVSVGDGRGTSFWNDLWLGEAPLKECFADLYRISSQRNATVREVYENGDNITRWRLNFRRLLWEWENLKLQALEQEVAQFIIREEVEDDLCWSHSVDKKYSTKSFYFAHEQALGLSTSDLNKVWFNCIPPKVQVFVWLLMQNKVATRDVLRRKNILPILGSIVCPLCEECEESSSHLFFHCEVAWRIWGLILEWWGMHWVWSENSKDAFLSWHLGGGKKQLKKLWCGSFYAAVWGIWIYRNDIVFRDKRRPILDIADGIMMSAIQWARAWGEVRDYSVNDLRFKLGTIMESLQLM